jgi:hypothetical protein
MNGTSKGAGRLFGYRCECGKLSTTAPVIQGLLRHHACGCTFPRRVTELTAQELIDELASEVSTSVLEATRRDLLPEVQRAIAEALSKVWRTGDEP